jgi:superfamily II DNA or RNA helicase
MSVAISYSGKKAQLLPHSIGDAMAIEHINQIREFFSVKNDAAAFARARGFFAAERKYAITPSGKFPIGLTGEILQYCKDVNIETVVHPSAQAVYTPSYNLTAESTASLKLPLRDYQQTIVSTCLAAGRGVIELATAGGKTLVIATLVETLFKTNNRIKILIVVPDLGLVHQTSSDFESYGVSFSHSKWTGNNELDLSTNVIIANMGILFSSNSDTSWIEHVDCLIVDEVHKMRKDNNINKIIEKVRADHKFGFTGTMPEKNIDCWNIYGIIGPKLFTKKAYELKQENYVSKSKVQVIKLSYKDAPSKMDYRKELEFIMTSSYRNSFLSSLCNKTSNNTLILVDFLAHGEALFEAIKAKCPSKEVHYIRGEVEVEDRKKVQDSMEVNTNVVVIAISKIFSTGINIKNLHYIIFAGGGKAKVKIVQSIGRGLRLHEDKKVLIVFDIIDNLNYGIAHGLKRRSLYNQEQIPFAIAEFQEK